ncbi:MAG: hypothetical protein NTY38_07610, partial [Acidobacteria bacterium]|nr:hypothetical protein [Acidobacteriota bacterium]
MGFFKSTSSKLTILAFAAALLLVCFLPRSLNAGVSPLAAQGYSVLPEPQQVQLTGKDFRFGPDWR